MKNPFSLFKKNKKDIYICIKCGKKIKKPSNYNKAKPVKVCKNCWNGHKIGFIWDKDKKRKEQRR